MDMPNSTVRIYDAWYSFEGLQLTKVYETVTKKGRILKNISISGLDCWVLGIY